MPGPQVAAEARGGPRPLVLGLSPVLVRYGQEARSYAMVTLVAIGAWRCLVEAVTRSRSGDPRRSRRWWVALALLTVLGEAGHGLFVLQTVAQGASLLALSDRRRLVRAFAPAATAAVACAGLLALVGAGEVADWIPPVSRETLLRFGAHLAGPGAAGLVVVTLVVAGAGSLTGRDAVDEHQSGSSWSRSPGAWVRWPF